MVPSWTKATLPLAIIPATLYVASNFGHEAATALVGIIFFLSAVKAANNNERRFMVTLAVFAGVLESAFVAIGWYKYAGTTLIPMWITLGWSLLGIYVLKNAPLMKNIKDRVVYPALVVFYTLLMAVTGVTPAAALFSAFAIGSVYILSASSKHPASFFAFAGIVGILVDFAGTAAGAWTYFNNGVPVPPPLAFHGMGYASVLAFAMWASGVE